MEEVSGDFGEEGRHKILRNEYPVSVKFNKTY